MGSAPGWESRQAKLLVPVRQRGRELVCPVDATAVNDHHDLCPGMAKERHHLLDRVAQPLGITLGDDCREDFRGAIVDGADNAEQSPTGHTAPTPVGPPRVTFAHLCAFNVAGTEGADGEAKTLGGGGAGRWRGGWGWLTGWAVGRNPPARGCANRQTRVSSSSSKIIAPRWARDSKAASAHDAHDRSAGLGTRRPVGRLSLRSFFLG